MSKEYIEKEVDKIIDSGDYKVPLNFAMAGTWILGNLKGVNLKVLDVKKTSSLADFFVIASATNTTQAKAMADEIIVQLKRRGGTTISKEGFNDTDWILIDFGDVIFHIFQEMSRDVYDLENLWRDAKPVRIPDEFYFSTNEAEKAGTESQKNGLDFF